MNDSARNRPSQDVGNVLLLEHVNVTIPDQETATTFYVTGLGFTRDPYMMVGSDNMWVNVGRQQFHMPKGPPQRFRGVVGLVVPDIAAFYEQALRAPARVRDVGSGSARAEVCVGPG